MGRLPDTFAQKKIMYRQPYAMFGEKNVVSLAQNQLFADATYQNATDKPFEIHRMKPVILALDNAGVALPTQPDQDLLQSIVRVKIEDLGKSTPLLKVPTPFSTLVKGTAERTWEWAEPYYLVKSEQFQVSVNCGSIPVITNLASLQVLLTFEGFFVVVTPPSENR